MDDDLLRRAERSLAASRATVTETRTLHDLLTQTVAHCRQARLECRRELELWQRERAASRAARALPLASGTRNR